MVATFSFLEAYGTSILINGSITNANLGNLGSPNLVAATYPITRGNNSYEKFIAGSWGGTFTKISNLQFAMTSGSYGTGEVIKWTGSVQSWYSPVTTTSGSAVGSVPTSLANNVTIRGSLTGSLIASPGSSDYIILQYQTTSSAQTGPANQKTFTLQYDEQ